MVSKARTDPLQAYCAVCGVQSGTEAVPERHLGARYKCSRGPMELGHVAAIVRPAMQRWVRFAASLAKYQVFPWLPRNLIFGGSTEPYIVVGLALLIGAVAVPYTWYPVGVAVARIGLGGFIALDVVVYSASVAFVTQGPRLALRTVVLTIAGFLQLCTAFAVLYRALAPPVTYHAQWLVGASHRNLSAPEAMYVSLVTMATVGFGDIRPADGAWLTQTAVEAQIVVGLVFLACVLATVIGWINAAPSLRTLEELLKE
jgi:hypothetical protein